MSLYEEVRTFLEAKSFRPKKSRGQNFLVHQNVIDGIVRLLDLTGGEQVVEIGPGLGFLTCRLLQAGAEVWAVEIDEALVAFIEGRDWGQDAKFHLIHGDILSVPLIDHLPAARMKLVGNLPYNIATPVLFRIFDWCEHFSVLVLMVQREVADRMMAQPGSKDYGALSVWCQVYGRVTGKLAVAPEAFFPRPKVRSMVLRIDLFERPRVSPVLLPVLRGLVRAAFGQRRKTLVNALLAWLPQRRDAIVAMLEQHQIDAKRRGETLTVAEFLSLAANIEQRRWKIAE